MDDNILVEKIEDLTQSLHRTKDVLSTADQMLDHYRDLNREQEHEIARLQGELIKSSRPRQKLKNSQGGELLQSLEYPNLRPISSRKMTSTPKVHFESELSPLDHGTEFGQLESSVGSLLRKQDQMERELIRGNKTWERELGELNATIQSKLAKPPESNDADAVHRRLMQIESQIREENQLREGQQKQLRSMSNEMKAIRDIVQEATTPQTSIGLSRVRPDLQKEQLLARYKKKLKEDEKKIQDLQEEVRSKKEEDSITLRSLYDELSSRERTTNKIIQKLEDQLHVEEVEKQKLRRELEDLQSKAHISSKESADLAAELANVKSELRLMRESAHQPSSLVPELKMQVEKSERQREQLSEHIDRLRKDCHKKDLLLEKFTIELDQLTARADRSEEDRRRCLSELEDTTRKLRDASRELDVAKAALLESKALTKESEDGKNDMKRKALEAIQEYRSKCQELEKGRKDLLEQAKTYEVEHSKMLCENKELEIANLKSQKEIKDLKYQAENTEKELLDSRGRLAQALFDKAQLEEVLTTVNNDLKDCLGLKAEIEELKSVKFDLASQLNSERQKTKDVEDKFRQSYENCRLLKAEHRETQRRLEEVNQLLLRERSSYQLEVERLRTNIKATMHSEESTLRKLLGEEQEKQKKAMEACERTEAELTNERSVTKLLKVDLAEKEKAFNLASVDLKRAEDETKQIKKRFQLLRRDLESKLKVTEESAREAEDRKSKLESELSRLEETLLKTKESHQQSLACVASDVDNLLAILTQEGEQDLPVKGLPENLSFDTRKTTADIQEKLQRCYLIAKTLKERFQHQKTLIRKAQVKIRSQMEDLEQEKLAQESLSAKLSNRIKMLESENSGQGEKILKLESVAREQQFRINDLSKHLEQSTKALNKSVLVMEEKRKVLSELDSLKRDHREHQMIEQDFYRSAEKVDTLKEQIKEAKESLQMIKKDSMDTTIMTNKIIDNFGSVSPARKRRLFSTDMSRKSNSRSAGNSATLGLSSYLADLESTPVLQKRENKMNDDLMSMTDEEFHNRFVSRSSPENQSPM